MVIQEESFSNADANDYQTINEETPGTIIETDESIIHLSNGDSWLKKPNELYVSKSPLIHPNKSKSRLPNDFPLFQKNLQAANSQYFGYPQQDTTP
jgi:hypothetical protein